MPRFIHRTQLSQPTLFQRPHRHPPLHTFPPDIQEKIIRAVFTDILLFSARVVARAANPPHRSLRNLSGVTEHPFHADHGSDATAVRSPVS